ncbi:MAG: tripartite tricarboxylate transporter substrate binding protein BugD [Hyphomicrobiales bacterium]|nr:MAG: tripartite tricarboxylate transporter substrate binding protein BugD [Hyphomicrobiales bacterium]
MLRRLLFLSAFLGCALALVPAAHAQDYPTKPITLIVPFAAGGPTDAIARIVAERMRTSLGQPIVIENVGGANGTIAEGRVARAQPDGYTIGTGNIATNVFNAAVYPLQYDLVADFEPIGLMVTAPALIVGTKSLPADDLAGLIRWLKANPDAGSAGVFAVWARLLGLTFQEQTGTKFQFVAYRGAGPAMQDMVAGHIQIMFDQAGNSLPQLRAGTIKAFAVAATKRLEQAPSVPTTDEAGFAGLHMSIWHGLWAPKGTPASIVTALNKAMRAALADPGAQKQLAELGQEISPVDDQTPTALLALQKSEADKWWPIIRKANITP